MGAAALEHNYSYPFESRLEQHGGGSNLRLATSGGTEKNPYFFKGKLTHPRSTADLLLALSLISRTRFYTPPNMLARILAAADPVVTSGGERLRLEAFSVCCGVYARVDLMPEAIEGEFVGRGTTNVDFNPPMRAALARIRLSEDVGLAVGTDRVELLRASEKIVERKVALPLRWLKGFVEVQAYQARMQPRLEISGEEARRFLRTVPRQNTHYATSWVLPAGKGLRISQRPSSDAVAVGVIGRLKILDDIARHAQLLRVYGAADDAVSGWEVVTDDARFHLVLSPEAARGFSGEGQVLSQLAQEGWKTTLPNVRASLKWQARVDAAGLAQQLGLDAQNVGTALSALGSRGLVGYDLAERAYFHRELPFDMTLVDDLQPRLKDARELVAEKGVRVMSGKSGQIEAYVRGTDVEHRVRETADGMKCTCPWYSKNQGQRGPCKHILAVQITLEAE